MRWTYRTGKFILNRFFCLHERDRKKRKKEKKERKKIYIFFLWLKKVKWFPSLLLLQCFLAAFRCFHGISYKTVRWLYRSSTASDIFPFPLFLSFALCLLLSDACLSEKGKKRFSIRYRGFVTHCTPNNIMSMAPRERYDVCLLIAWHFRLGMKLLMSCTSA